MNRLKITTRIAMLSLFSGVLLLLVGGMGIRGVQHANEALRDSYEQRLIPVSLLADIQSRLLMNRLLVATALVTPTPEMIQKTPPALSPTSLPSRKHGKTTCMYR